MKINKLSEIPHKKVTIGNDIYYICRYPEGDAHIHHSTPNDKEGYAGRTIDFLLENGSIESVKGPYCRDIMFDFGTRKKLAKFLSDDSILPHANRLKIGTNLSFFYVNKNEKIDFEETEWSLLNPIDRFDPSWHRKQAVLYLRGGSRFIKSIDCSMYKHMWE